MPKSPVIQTFTRGYNGDASPFVLDVNQLSAVKNMLFERGLLISRPGLSTVTSTLGYPFAVAAWSRLFGAAGGEGLVQYQKAPGGNVFIRRLSVIKNHPTTPFLSELFSDFTGAALTAPLDGLNEVGGPLPNLYTNIWPWVTATGDLIHANLAALTYNVTGTPPGKVETAVMQGTRAIAAGRTTPILYWSKIGDTTVWTGDYTTGSNVLDNGDNTLILSIIRNTIVAMRASSVTLGVVTGNGGQPFDWKTISTDGRGACFPTGSNVYDYILYYIGQNNVHTFDMAEIKDIGEGIVTELFGYLRTYGVVPRVFITKTYKDGYRPQLHIIPTYMAGYNAAAYDYTNVPKLPHFIYDITEGMWSRHVYDTFANDTYMYSGFALNYTQYPSSVYVRPFQAQQCAPCLLRCSSPSFQYVYWDHTQPCESAMSFTTGRIQLGDASSEVKLVRMMVVAYCSTAATSCTATFTSFLGNTDSSVAKSFTLGAGWQRVWVNNIKVGQFFTIKIDIPAGVQVMFRQLILDTETSQQEVRV